MDMSTKMLELIARTPLIRTMQLADALDVDLEHVERLLTPYLFRSDIVGQDVQAPNGRKATGYDFSEKFKQSDVYAALVRSAPEAPKSSVPTFAPKVSAPTMTNEARAIAFIREKGGTATSAELHAMLGLKPTEYASSYLGLPLRAGRLVKNGKDWTLGESVQAAQPAPRPTAVDAVVREINALLPPASTPPVDKIPDHGQKVGAAPAAAKAAPAPEVVKTPVFADSSPLKSLKEALRPAPNFRCAIWSDGALELHRDGKPLAVLSVDERTAMLEFIDRTDAALL